MKIKLAISISISFVFLVWAFRDVHFAEFWNTLKTVEYRYFILALVITITNYGIRAYRWKYLLILQKDIRFLPVFSATSIGYFANSILPFRAGEFLRAYVIGRSEQVSKSAALATILVERIIDVLSILFCALIAIFFFPIPENTHYETIKYFGMFLFIIEMSIIIFCFMLVIKRDFSLRIVEKILGILSTKAQKSGKNITNSFLNGLEIIKSTQHFFKIIVLTCGNLLFTVMQIYVLLLAFNVRLKTVTMLIASIVDMVLICFALTIPSAPSFVGTFHAAAKEGLAIFSIDPNISSGFAVLFHAVTYIPITLIGFYFFLRENIKISTARADFQKEFNNF